MQLKKDKRRATLCWGDGRKQDVNFFLRQFAENHSGKELIIDVLNSKAAFIPLEDTNTGDILFVNKARMMSIELYERDLSDETMPDSKVVVHVELINGETLRGCFLIEMPQERSRVSDYLNFSPAFIYLCSGTRDIIINKAFVFSVRDIEPIPEH
ncbi:hypothetical protein PITCH_A1120008 [uncultured Desulfobacterium sp.]|uniref:Uncharacterized protein n=1 Tax=uncultured Desulfobacterium sp. TaxID=201089 RepID=A0A445MR84_9BACT|nr:hypothetical protein PITCH_A1120008 [uncultured Desulfobacterium sp.]